MSDKGKQVAVGIDLGGTAVKIGLVDTSYEVVAQTSIPTNGDRPYEQVIADMGNTAAKLLEENGYTIADCLGAGVGSPGIIDSENGIVLYSNNIQWDHVPLADVLGKYLPVPVFVQNDANCATLGEVLRGAGKGYQNAVFLTLGTGVGGGIVIDGEIFEGGHSGGAELGHIKCGSERRRCTCGRYDCLEAYASATALIDDAKKMAAQHPDSTLWELCGHDLETMNAKMPFDAAEAGDSCGKTLVENYIGYLADGIADLANIFRPDIIVLGGGVCAQGEKLTNPLNQYLRENCFGNAVTYIPQVVIAKNGNLAGLIGAAGLVYQHCSESSK
ncbi:MAG: ROK family protein [Lachnospiraceae bacterium]|nr:ROK family protein [Lachnospiraceae bacterium]